MPLTIGDTTYYKCVSSCIANKYDNTTFQQNDRCTDKCQPEIYNFEDHVCITSIDSCLYIEEIPYNQTVVNETVTYVTHICYSSSIKCTLTEYYYVESDTNTTRYYCIDTNLYDGVAKNCTDIEELQLYHTALNNLSNYTFF